MSNKILNVMDGYHAIEHKSYITIYDPDCAEFCRIYKKSTADALVKVKTLLWCLNETRESAEDAECLRRALAQKDKDSTRLQFELAEQKDKLREDLAKLSDQYDKMSTENRRTQEQFHFMRNVIENQSVALRNISGSLEK